MASTTSPVSPQLFPPDFFQLSDAGAASIGKSVGSKQGSHEVGLHCFDILERILQDPELEAGKTCGYTDDAKFSKTVEKAGDRIRSYARLWMVSKDSVPAKLEELAWLATLIFGLGGFRKGHAFRCDFFLYVNHSPSKMPQDLSSPQVASGDEHTVRPHSRHWFIFQSAEHASQGAAISDSCILDIAWTPFITDW